MSQFAVITGASAGLGAEFARQLAAQGYSLMLVARRADRLQALADSLPVPCEIFPADLAREEECRRLVQALRDRRVDLFVNNAGFGACGAFPELDLDRELAMVDLNVRAVHLLTKAMVRQMQHQGGGALLNVGSSAGLLPAGPYMAAYYATKSYVVSLSRAVAAELRAARSPVYLGCLCPGPVNTEFNGVAGVRHALPGLSAERCVASALAGVRHRKTVIVPGRGMAAAMALSRLVPVPLLIRLTAHQQRRKLGG